MAVFRLWGWQQWLLVGLVLSLCGYQLIIRQHERLETSQGNSIAQLESQIASYKFQSQRIAVMEQLSPVKKNWSVVEAIVKTYGVNLESFGEDRNQDAYQGPLDAWQGAISGSTQTVLVTARKMQSLVPVYFYSFELGNGNMSINFSVLGGATHD